MNRRWAALAKRFSHPRVPPPVPDTAAARRGIEQLLGLDHVQATVVLDMQMRRISIKERDKIHEELKALRASIDASDY